MKGKNKFTKQEEKEIKLLLSQLRDASREKQKKTRNILRTNFNFYISHFTSSKKGFTLDDFVRLKNAGEIIVI